MKLTERIRNLINNFQAHSESTNNPHGVTKGQVGLGNVDNTADADKPISAAVQAELDLLELVEWIDIEADGAPPSEDVTGRYVFSGMEGGKPAYVLEAGTARIYWDASAVGYFLMEVGSGHRWATAAAEPDAITAFGPQGGSTGNLTATFHTRIPRDLVAYYSQPPNFAP